MVLPLNSGRCLDNEWMVSLGRRLAADGPFTWVLQSHLSLLFQKKKRIFFNFLYAKQLAGQLPVPPWGWTCPSSESMESQPVGHQGTHSHPSLCSSTAGLGSSRVDVDVCLCQHHSISPHLNYYLAYSRCPIPGC